MHKSASPFLDCCGSVCCQGARHELIAHLHEVAARVYIDESRPETVLQAMLNIEQYLRGILPDLEQAGPENRARGPAILC